jgi:hypothetical protein
MLDLGSYYNGLQALRGNPPSWTSLSLGFNEATRCLRWGKGQKGWIYIGSMHVLKKG